MGMFITVRVTPRSKKQSCSYDAAGRIVIHLRSVPEQGAANAELLEYLAEKLNVSRRLVSLASGATSRTKRVVIDADLSLDEIYQKLGLDKALQGKIG